jgi:hypothetical protein
VPACALDVLSELCEPWLVAHCQAHPEDRECDQYGWGPRLWVLRTLLKSLLNFKDRIEIRADWEAFCGTGRGSSSAGFG